MQSSGDRYSSEINRSTRLFNFFFRSHRVICRENTLHQLLFFYYNLSTATLAILSAATLAIFKMPFVVLPALVEDIERIYDIQFAAFKDEPIMRFLYPHGVDRKLHTEGTHEWWKQDQIGHPVKCVDTETGEIVGMAVWDIFWRPGEEHAFQKPEGIPWLTGDDKKKCERILMPMWDMRVQLFGKRRYICKFPDRYHGPKG